MENRIEKWDNVRGLLIFLVVLGHMIEPGVNSQGHLRWLFLFIYIFHMPGFFLLSGLFSKSAIQNRKYDRAAGYLFLYFAMKMLVFLTNILVTGKPGAFHLYWEDGTPWYAFCMAAFLLAAIVLRGIKKTYILIGAVLLACFAGYDDAVGDTFVLSRILVFFPFFFLGSCIQEDVLRKRLRSGGVRIASGIIVLLVFGIILYNCRELYWIRTLVTGRNPFSKLSKYADFGGCLRLLYYGAALVLVLAFIALIPERHLFLGTWGKNALSIYFFHKPLINLLNIHGWRDRFINWSVFPTHLLPCLILTILVVFVCGGNIPYKICRKIMDVSMPGDRVNGS